MQQKMGAKQETIVCQVCDKVIETIDSCEGVKTLYGVCKDCSQ
ncbi:GapA-binding peptide SR1P [Mesobacillus maritimus]|nr:GapA-binding peptide SR1P [Mesobacillus maritimus]MCM3584882.1 GapA-binding peptide SR1P [Mesobacillus maritimus]